jgi:hypothetical protein
MTGGLNENASTIQESPKKKHPERSLRSRRMPGVTVFAPHTLWDTTTFHSAQTALGVGLTKSKDAIGFDIYLAAKVKSKTFLFGSSLLTVKWEGILIHVSID